ncbi:DUF881 domain-containing protein [Ornithinimicrobium avium]|uniref:DUF881 domain-containing protein n=1 Tax=Ornithinimicrobium avium TaxID=2283195 RepID=A0A345NJQ9_9MICO|nr:DUF881 domain-containing protein [Ornithinimicrobium avium]AXH95267.1 DUF881 domain-containing protein [Ornithinimicrobium avium]
MRFLRLGQASRDPDPAASMALLGEVLDPPIGPGYHSAARARVEAGLPASSGSRTWLLFVTAVVLGMLVTVAAVTLRAPDPVAAETRKQLITRIEAAQEAGDASGARVEELRAEILSIEQERARLEEGPAAERAITSAGEQAGARAVSGPGVVIVLEDASSGGEGAPGLDGPGERVNARDVQLVVNGLWSAGAEAVSVNGHRLTSTSAIRFAGEAIIVDFRSLAPPYEIRAIGDPERLAAETSSGVTGAYLDQLRGQLGIASRVSVQEDVTIASAERLTTRYGHVLDRTAQDDTTEEDRR